MCVCTNSVMCTVCVCVGDAAGRSGGPTGDFTVGRLSVCSPSFLRDGEQPAVIRCVLCLRASFPLIQFLGKEQIFLEHFLNRFDCLDLKGLQLLFSVRFNIWIRLMLVNKGNVLHLGEICLFAILLGVRWEN